MNRASSATGWVRNPDGTLGWTWNPITGCLNHTPEGLCLGGMSPCYAYKLANGRLRHLYLANKNWCTKTPEGYEGYPNLDPFYPRFWEDRVDKMSMYTGVGKGIFVCDMSDLFGVGVPEQWTNQVFQAMKFNPRNRFYLLTKQPQNLPQWSPFPENCYVGVTATDTDMAVAGMTVLSEIEAKVKYVSFEPLLARIPLIANGLSGINWVIIGAQTKPTVYPKIEWVREIETAARKAGIAIFEKDNLKPILNRDLIQELP